MFLKLFSQRAEEGAATLEKTGSYRVTFITSTLNTEWEKRKQKMGVIIENSRVTSAPFVLTCIRTHGSVHLLCLKPLSALNQAINIKSVQFKVLCYLAGFSVDWK